MATNPKGLFKWGKQTPWN